MFIVIPVKVSIECLSNFVREQHERFFFFFRKCMQLIAKNAKKMFDMIGWRIISQFVATHSFPRVRRMYMEMIKKRSTFLYRIH